MKRIFVDTNDGQIHCRTEGTGEPILLLHQVPCSSSEFSEAIPILGKYFRVIAMDCPPYGDSYKPIKELEIEDLAHTALELLDALNIGKAHIAGHHSGATIAVEIAATYPQRVDKLILSGCPSLSEEQRIAWRNNSPYRALEITRDGWFMRHIWDFVIQRIPEDQLNKAYEFALDYMKAGARSEDGHQAAFRYEIISKIERIKQPTLVLGGDKDLLFQFHETTLKHIPHAQSYVIKGGTVQTPRLLPQEWVNAILQFLKG